MKLRNRIISLAFVAIIAFSMATMVMADDYGITPYYNNTLTTQDTFRIDANGMVTFSFLCRGYRGITTKIEVESVIQKQVGSSWVDVEGACWTDESTTTHYCTNEYTYQLSERGTYKSVVTYTVYGSGGEADVIVSEIEKTY